MFPKLSEKALTELGQKNWRYILNGNDEEMPFYVAVEAFMSLFDLEQYPITREQLFSYVKNESSFDKMRLTGNMSDDDTDVWKISGGAYEFYLYEHNDNLTESLQDISLILKKDKIIIIGEIHGWWEEGGVR